MAADDPATATAKPAKGNLAGCGCALLVALLLVGGGYAGYRYDRSKVASGTETRAEVVQRELAVKPDCVRQPCRIRRIEIAYESEEWRATEDVWRPLASEMPILRFMPIGATLPVRYDPDNPRQWELVFDHDAETTRNHVRNLMLEPTFEEAVVRVDPVVLSKAGERGYVPVHVPAKIDSFDWAEAAKLDGDFTNDSLDPKRSCQPVFVPSKGERTKLDSFEHRRTPKGGHDDLFILDDVKPGESLEIMLWCRDRRFGPKKRLMVTFATELSTTAKRLEPSEAKFLLRDL